MIFSLLGCAKTNNMTPEQAVQRYLNKKYDSEFVIEEFSRKGGSGPFKSSMYTGYAYESSQKALKFNIWMTKDYKEFYDSYSWVEKSKEIDDWLMDKGKLIWKDCQIHDTVQLYDYSIASDIPELTTEEFLLESSMLHEIILCIPSNTDTSHMENQVWDFLEILGDSFSGMLYIYTLDADDIQYDELYYATDKYEPQWRISLGADRDSIARKFAK